VVVALMMVVLAGVAVVVARSRTKIGRVRRGRVRRRKGGRRKRWGRKGGRRRFAFEFEALAFELPLALQAHAI